MARSLSLVALFSCTVVINAFAQTSTGASTSQEDTPAFRRTRQNTYEFNHRALSPVHDAPAVLRVKDGEYFQVRFLNTDPRKFRYTVSVTDDAAALRQTSFAAGRVIRTDVKNLTDASVTMRHDENVTRYRVSATLLDGVTSDAAAIPTQAESRAERAPAAVPEGQPKPAVPAVELVSLNEISFDLWIETTKGWQLSFSGGTAFSNLTNDKYFISTDTKGTATADDDVKLVKLDADKNDSFRPDIMAIANLSHPKARGVGLAFGLGLNNDADPRYFFGPSVLLGDRFILHGGFAGGKVAALPPGQEVEKAPIAGDNTLSTGASRFKRGIYIGIAFTFVDREEQFKGAFSGNTTGKASVPPADTTPADASPVARDTFVGVYTSAEDNRIEVGIATDDGIFVTVDKNDPISFTSENRKGLVWSKEVKAADGSTETVQVTFTLEGTEITGLEYKRGTTTIKADKQ